MKPAKEEKRQQNQQNVYAGCADCKNLLGVSRSANKVSLFVFSLLILIPIILHIEQPKIIRKRLVSCIKRKYKRNAKTPKSTSADLCIEKYFSLLILVIFLNKYYSIIGISQYVPLGISAEKQLYFPS